ncbi:MAG TPA: thiamine-phosphate kinase [Nitrososphaera sp.]
MTKLDEKEIVGILTRRLGIRDLDDVAPITGNIVMKCDMLVSSTDVPPGMGPAQIARKSIVSCASDLAAKGATPLAAMVSLGLPRNCTRPYVEGLAEGFAGAAGEFGVKIVGGDTNEASELVIDCCMIGLAAKKMPTRSGARPGDYVVVSGSFGHAAAGLAILLRNARATGMLRKQSVDSVLEPKPRQRFGTILGKFFSSSIDSSDGLAICLYELALSSGVDIVVKQVPTEPGLDRFGQDNDIDVNELVFHGGEEYEIVATIPGSKLKQAESAARKAKVPLLIIGRVRKGTGKVFVGKRLLENRGYVHFQRR